MKKRLLFALAATLMLTIVVPSAWAEESATEDEFVLEEIIVSAEKRNENIQKVPASVFVVSGVDLTELGKSTTAEILEEIPGVDWSSSQDIIGSGHAQPDAGIKIRGIARKESSDGQPPSAVATYVDGVFEGMGGNYDIERVEILRGPQGTLYGRSATGGVVAFHTKDPVLSEFGGSVSLTYGSEELKNIEAAVNAPLGETFALRVAAHYHSQEDAWVGEGGYTETKEGRAKLLFQPTDQLRILLTGQAKYFRYNGGGCSQTYITTDSYDACGAEEDVSYGNFTEMYQGTLDVSYDFGGSVLTYIGSYRNYEDTDNPDGSIRAYPQWIFRDVNYNPGESFHTEELRWASDGDGKWSWLFGANYYYSDFDRTHGAVQALAYEYVGGPEDSPPDSYEAPVFDQTNAGHTYNLGFFTEHTYELTDDLRITAGLRYDKSEVKGDIEMRFNTNLTEYGNSLKPASYISTGYAATRDWDNFTYKLRLEYDLAPDNMVYATVATGFLPGDVRLSLLDFSSFLVLPYDEEKLTSYEVGTKNRFFNNRLQLNASLFYYDYEDYRNTVNLATTVGGSYTIVVTPLEMYGAELELMYLITEKDKIALNFAWLEAEIDNFPIIVTDNGSVDSKEYMALSDIPGNSPFTGMLRYERTIYLPKGNILAPRLTLRYTDGYYLTQLTQAMVDMGQMPYDYQDDYVTCDFGVTLTSADGKYSASLYVNNLFDETYKRGAYISSVSLDANTVYLANPRNYGVNFRVRF